MPQEVGSARFDLVCLPYSGASASAYRAWGEIMAPLAQVHAVAFPGRGSRWSEAPVSSMTELVQSLRTAVVTSLRRPLVIFGHSLGALVAFELARAMRAHGDREPVLLVVSGRASPQGVQTMPPGPESPEAEFIEHLRWLGGTPEAVFEDPDLLDIVLPPVRDDYRMLHAWRYRPQPPLDIPLVAHVGHQDRTVPLEQMIGWEQQTRAGFDLVELPGGHFYTAPGLVEPARDLRRRLARLG